MRDELDTSGQWQRLVELYRAMSDEELLGLAARPGDLTDEAQGVLRNEMAGRRLQSEAAPGAEARHREWRSELLLARITMRDWGFLRCAQREPEMKPEPAEKGLAKGTVVLTTFLDAIAAGVASDFLEAEGMEIEVRDVAKELGGGGSFYGEAPVLRCRSLWLRRELKRAMNLLQEKMGIFPVQEVEEADEAIDDGTTAMLGAFGHRATRRIWRECWRRRGSGTALRPMRREGWRMKTRTRWR